MDPYRLGLVATRIHYFQLVARLGSIRQVALVLSVAPSSISRVLKQLEEELGTPLFEGPPALKLTSAGELMLYHARVAPRNSTGPRRKSTSFTACVAAGSRYRSSKASPAG